MFNFIKKIANGIEIHTLRTKLIISFLIIGLLPILLFGFLSFNVYSGAINDRINNYSQEMVNRMKRDLEDYITEVERFLSKEQDFYINQFIKLTQANDFRNSRKYAFRIWEDFNNVKQLRPGLKDVAITFQDGRRISSYGTYNIDIDNFKESLYADESDETFFTQPYINYFQEEVVTVARYYYPEIAEENVLISADIDLDVLADLTDFNLGEKSYFLIADQNGDIIYHPEKSKIGERSFYYSDGFPDRKVSLKGEQYLLTSTYSEVTGWYIISMASADEVEAELNYITNLTIYMTIIVLILIILLTLYLSSSLSKPIQKLQELTHRASENDLSVKIEISGDDEIAELGQSFNKMIRRINKLMEQNVREQKFLRQLEMESLDNQIKPHFIYNTLDLIIGLLENKDFDRATHMVEALGKFFRLSLSHGKEMVLIRNEIKHVKNYLFIQQFRHGEEYEYIIDIEDPEIMDKHIPKLILQPIVENSIYHGLLPADKKGLIIIKGLRKNKNIYFKIVDNGVGIAPEKVEEINKILKGELKIDDQQKYFGLRNVNQRLKLMYGGNSGLKVESVENEKTMVTIRIDQRGGK
ncbi:sensor histidine kinase [Halanaerobium congolense]|jgi:two-component system sensor histidine kinase YesM|uniref:Two-component system sensor histidine kinase YesM n=2 Tax=Halanaerobium congolense TaxID=54121 RepID=A0A1G6LVE2_9FIRM|nr:sensor histidine kinase [Halanaerobium congolense]KXS47951.1 MAG: two-component system, sensor histidine kinase YesM [Halanaerobium sp. T82-1]PUU91854.1 MAG: two-component system, sensor histidine kinase YesM [Halanaerobium sp.]PXV67317.1 two-component system sensor histidine kinase YesM [Halanaerobium congolense]TDP16995.1 two-component system sensor histidine kinase YesM [Halanaerobium congolense]TDS34579.1 two-component system sensor histidine kinase YesM [Halanaerobium congolense]